MSASVSFRYLAAAAMLCGVFAISCDRTQWNYSSDDRPKKEVVLRADSVHEGWYFACGDHVVIDGTVNGDVYAAGGTVIVNGKVNGDLIVAGGRVEMNGAVTDAVRAAGGNIVINGTVGKDVTAAGGQIEIGKSAVVAGNLLGAGG